MWAVALTAILGAFCGDYFLIPPRGSLNMKDPAQYFGLGSYLVVSLGIAVLAGLIRNAVERNVEKLGVTLEALAQAEERLRLTVPSSGLGLWNWELTRNHVGVTANCSPVLV